MGGRGTVLAATFTYLTPAVRAMATFPIYLFIFIVFLNRYVFGLYLSLTRGRKFDERVDGYEPTITVVVPLYNEGPSIYDTIVSLVGLAGLSLFRGLLRLVGLGLCVLGEDEPSIGVAFDSR